MRGSRHSKGAALAAIALLAGACNGGGETPGIEDGPAADGGEHVSFIYVTPTPIGVNKFLELGQVGTESAARASG